MPECIKYFYSPAPASATDPIFAPFLFQHILLTQFSHHFLFYYYVGDKVISDLLLHLGMPSFQKSAVFLNIVQKDFDPPPFYLNICPILQGVFFEHYMNII